MNEKWAKIPGYPSYSVSSEGAVTGPTIANAITILRDRLFASTTFAGAVGQDEPDSVHEDAAEVCERNFRAIKLTDHLDPTDRSHEKWELEAAARLLKEAPSGDS